ncbi:MAG: hypothetical protein QOF00_5968, partial [Pseudonocardiales bacterium]|nr:hypothetical protein [Pseudonocardiales bacterium]
MVIVRSDPGRIGVEAERATTR